MEAKYKNFCRDVYEKRRKELDEQLRYAKEKCPLVWALYNIQLAEFAHLKELWEESMPTWPSPSPVSDSIMIEIMLRKG